MRSLFNYSRVLRSVSFVSFTVLTILSTPGLTQLRGGLSGSLPSSRYDDYDLEKYERLLNQSEREYQQALRQFQRADQDLSAAQAREQEINQNIQKQGRLLEINEQKIRELETSVQEKSRLLQQSQRQLQQTQDEIQKAENAISSTETTISEIESRLASAPDADKENLKNQINTQKKLLQDLKNKKDAEVRKQTQLTQQISQLQTQIAQAQNQIPNLQAESQKIRTRIAELQNNLNQATQRRQEFARVQQKEKIELESKDRELNTARRNVEVIRRNIEIAANILRQQGSQQGARDGSQEGYEIGTRKGQIDGESRGFSEGQDQGTRAGEQRDYETGFQEGQRKAFTDAVSQSSKDAQINGEKDGTTQGTKDGLQTAYDKGMEQGLAHGERTGDDRAAYQSGRKEGEAAGLSQAVTDAKPQYQLGYSAKENEFLSAPLKSVTVGDSQKFKGLQGRYSAEGDDRYYRPQPGILPHPMLQRFYLESYDQSYRDNLGQSYNSAYRTSYETAYRTAHSRAYNQAYQQKYLAYEKQGYQRGYQETYQKEYDKNYLVQFQRAYQNAYDRSFAQTKDHPQEIARGFADGNRIASRKKGYQEGYQAAYSGNIQNEKQKAYAAGSAAAHQLYSQNAVLKIEKIEIVDADNDRIFRPGEQFYVVMKIKNYGLKVKTDLQSVLIKPQGLVQVTSDKLTLASIPEQSDATVIAPFQALIQSQAIDGNQFGLTVQAVSGATVLGTQNFTQIAQFPATIQTVGFDGVLIPGSLTQLKLKVTNRSQKAQNLQISIQADPTKLELKQSSFAVHQLLPGTSQEISLPVTGKIEARFEETVLTTFTTQNNLKFSMDLAQNITLIQRHNPTANSKGLILSANLAQGAGKKLYALDRFDTWDLRVDGALSQGSKLDSYKNKTVHILADAHSSLDSSTLATLTQFVSDNGSLLVWGSQLSQSQMGLSILKSLGVSVQESRILNETVSGTNKLRGLSLNVRGQVTQLGANSIKGQNVLSSSVGNLAVIIFGQGTQENVGQSMVVGLDLQDLENQEIQKLLSAYGKTRMSYTNKLNQAVQSSSQTFLVVHDMQDEMIQAEISHKGSFYKNNQKSNKLYKAGAKLIGEAGRKSAVAAELAKFYPQLMKTLNTMLEKEQWQASLVLERRHGNFLNARNIRDLYCSDKSNDPLCKTGDFN